MKIDRLNNINIIVNNSNLDGFKIVHISDLHINLKTKKSDIINLVNQCLTLPYDILVITGDIIDCKANKLIDKLQILNRLRNAYFISGNHDLFYGVNDLKKNLNNIIFLDNRIDTLSFKDTKIAIAGLSDRFSKFFKIKRDEEKLLNSLKKYKNCILLAHQPKDYKLAVKNNINLFLCGHTHGGQIFPFHIFVKLFQPFLSGLYYKKNSAIYVNNGLGTWGVDFRYKAKSEIAFLKLIHS